ncbi:uncharacterized protein LOC120292463 [Eucalyptus grandis]|uniref:uncharacterized protein LOC120292463 n=1 Tax=Eucalyptus grandis TaxID=71139 RepID=UPI00192EEDD1|nr:uncharacterized protein LOC120292463 [Eucalyptus grandis]
MRLVQRERSRSAKPQGRDTSKNSSGKSWVAVARTVAKGYDLVYTPLTMVNNRLVIEITNQDLEAVDLKMFECLMGYFIGCRMPFKVVEEAMKKAWGSNLAEVMSNGKGLFMFRIPDREFCRSQWTPGLELRRETHRVVPVWVRLSNIPFSCWFAHFIRRVASALGKPLYVDKRTEQANSLTFARVYIEITADQHDCKLIETTHNGMKCEIRVEFEWRPTTYAGCGIFGHNCATANKLGRPGTEHADAGPSSEESGPQSKAASGNTSQQAILAPTSVDASED